MATLYAGKAYKKSMQKEQIANSKGPAQGWSALGRQRARSGGGWMWLMVILLWWPQIFIPIARAENNPTVVINELMWMGSSLSWADEWIELRNLSEEVVDLSGWQIEHAATSQGVLIIPVGKTLAPSGYFLISNYDVASSVLNINPDWVTPAVSLNNNGEDLILKTASGATVVDFVLADPWPAGENGLYFSMERNEIPGDGLSPGSWHTALDSVNFDAGFTGKGSPGAPNSVPPVQEPQPEIIPIQPGDILINEFNPQGSPDWAELYMLKGGLDISGLVLTDLDGTDTPLAEGAVTTGTGSYVVVHWTEGVDEADEKGDLNGNGYIDLYVDDTDLTATDDQLVLKNGKTVIDAVVWTNLDGTISDDYGKDVQVLIESGAWSGTVDETGGVALSSTANSLGRIDFVDTNLKADWQIWGNPTLGQMNMEPNYDYLVRLNELMPNPVGADETGEWIELYNTEKEDVNLDNWVLTDGTDEYVLPVGTKIGSGSFLIFDRPTTGITIANYGSETLQLISPEGAVRSETLRNGSFAEGATWAYFVEAGWKMTGTATQGNENVYSTPPSTGNSRQNPYFYATSNLEGSGDGCETAFYRSEIYLSEIMPSPVGADETGEWIELYNAENHWVDLGCFILDDKEGGSSPYKIPARVGIPARGFLVLTRPETGLALNNNGDEVRLFNPLNILLDSVKYEKAYEGKSYGRKGLGKLGVNVKCQMSNVKCLVVNNWQLVNSDFEFWLNDLVGVLEDEWIWMEPTLGQENAEEAVEKLEETQKQAEEEEEIEATQEQPLEVWAESKGGDYDHPIEVSLKTNNSNARIFFTLEPNNPDPETQREYKNPILIDQNTELMFFALLDEQNITDFALEKYLIAGNYTDKIEFNTLAVNPAGKDSINEYIELKNISLKEINLKNWSVVNKNKSYTFPDDQWLEKGDSAKFYITQIEIGLNNQAGEMRLYAPDWSLADLVSWNEKSPVKEGSVLTRKGEIFVWNRQAQMVSANIQESRRSKQKIVLEKSVVLLKDKNQLIKENMTNVDSPTSYKLQATSSSLEGGAYIPEPEDLKVVGKEQNHTIYILLVVLVVVVGVGMVIWKEE
ncbi:hypothetical protein AUJ78_01875 [Candidatus Peregrinibacteria bacterium CG1_02_41_10]|nr:MAG: hypothetical protein AUJ78_01875 [Candidatus Peregrinibacteria bacterium CG1_02_41_10]